MPGRGSYRGSNWIVVCPPGPRGPATPPADNAPASFASRGLRAAPLGRPLPLMFADRPVRLPGPSCGSWSRLDRPESLSTRSEGGVPFAMGRAGNHIGPPARGFPPIIATASTASSESVDAGAPSTFPGKRPVGGPATKRSRRFPRASPREFWYPWQDNGQD
jgi:hypothetical protein